jgi:Zn-dependent metalloprotease
MSGRVSPPRTTIEENFMNKSAVYLLAKGRTHHRGGTMQGTHDECGQDLVKALTTYMTSNSDFAAARAATRKCGLQDYWRWCCCSCWW